MIHIRKEELAINYKKDIEHLIVLFTKISLNSSIPIYITSFYKITKLVNYLFFFLSFFIVFWILYYLFIFFNSHCQFIKCFVCTILNVCIFIVLIRTKFLVKTLTNKLNISTIAERPLISLFILIHLDFRLIGK